VGPLNRQKKNLIIGLTPVNSSRNIWFHACHGATKIRKMVDHKRLERSGSLWRKILTRYEQIWIWNKFQKPETG
jgi:hypothetical protein